MSRLPLALAPALALALVATGCIAPQDVPTESNRAAVAPPSERIEGMTAEEVKEDKMVDCSGGDLLLPAFCAERDLMVTGRIGVDALPVELWGANGPISIKASDDLGDAWSFHVVYRVRGLTESEAMESLDKSFAWSHEEGDGHALRAGPRHESPLMLPGLGSSVVMARYEVELPAWVALEIDAMTSNGPITIEGVQATSVRAASSNGPIVFEGDAANLDLTTSNGPVEVVVAPTESGEFSLTTSNGPVGLRVVEGARYGYDIDASTSNGRVKIELDDGESRTSQDQQSGPSGTQHATFRSRDFDARQIQSVVKIETSNGPVTVRG